MTPSPEDAGWQEINRLIAEAMERFSEEELGQLENYVCSALTADMAIKDAEMTAQAFEHVMDRWRKSR